MASAAQAGKASRALAEHGQHIFIYAHVQTNQIIYSLSRAMNNYAALKQLPFLGRHSKPRALRKDHWQPLATVSFPSGFQGLAAYRKLREFRKRHEHEWTVRELREQRKHIWNKDEDFTSLKKEDGRFDREQAKKRRQELGRMIQDQKANSIADLAAVLLEQNRLAVIAAERDAAERQRNEDALRKAEERRAELVRLRREAKHEGTEESAKRYRDLKREKIKLQKAVNKAVPHKALEGKYDVLNDGQPPAKRGPGRRRRIQQIPKITMAGVKVEWANVLDAQFAGTWPETVRHTAMRRGSNRSRNVHTTKIKPRRAPTEIEARDEDVREKPEEPPVIQEEPPSRLRRLIDRLQHGRQR